MLAHLGAMLALCWPIFALCWAILGAMLDLRVTTRGDFGLCCFHNVAFIPKFCLKKLSPVACESHDCIVLSTVCLSLSSRQWPAGFKLQARGAPESFHQWPSGSSPDDRSYVTVGRRLWAVLPPYLPVGGLCQRQGQGRSRPDLKGLRRPGGKRGENWWRREKEPRFREVQVEWAMRGGKPIRNCTLSGRSVIAQSCCAYAGPSGVYVVAVLPYLETMLELCWPTLGPCWGSVGPCCGYVGTMLAHLGVMLGLCWPILAIFGAMLDLRVPPEVI